MVVTLLIMKRKFLKDIQKNIYIYGKSFIKCIIVKRNVMSITFL